MTKTLLVSDIMTKNVISVDASMTVKDAAEMMMDTNVGCIVVMKDNIATGIVTERDMVRRIISRSKPASTNVTQVMSSPLIVTNPHATVTEAAQLMKTRKIHKIPVVDDSMLVGMLTSTDLVRFCSDGDDTEISKITEQIFLRY